MTREEVEFEVRKIIAEQLAVPESEVDENSQLTALGADSLDNVEILMQIEEKFDIHFSDEDAEKITKFDDLVDMALKLIGEGDSK